MQQIDLRKYKTGLRDHYKAMRRSMPPEEKAQKDRRIKSRLQELYQYKRAKTLLCYVSTAIEVGTRDLIQEALADGKQVAVPYCIDNTRRMEFYLIHSMEDLEPRTFGVLEPVASRCQLLKDFSESLCIVPGLAYDLGGYRLGYGAGYYDRFLSSYSGIKVGIIYADFVRNQLPHGKYDVSVDLLVTERYLRNLKKNSPPLSGFERRPKPNTFRSIPKSRRP